MGREIDKGLYFQSSIPVQYGAGSSAALVAAVYDAFHTGSPDPDSRESSEIDMLRSNLAELESFYHGTSSGIDPLCSYLGRSLVIEQDGAMPADLVKREAGRGIFLIDSNLKGDTGALVNEFKSRIDRDPEFNRIINEDLRGYVEGAIRNICRGTDFKEDYRKISELQLRHFQSMIPGNIMELWETGLRSHDYYLKLCGSGGGGYFLGFSEEPGEMQSLSEKSGMKILHLDL
jgi:mevalonate kinase